MTQAPRTARPDRRGTVLVILVVLLLVIASIAGAILQAALVDARQITTDRAALQADRLAEAGLARALARLKIDADYVGETWNAPLAGDEVSTVELQVRRDGDRTSIESIATYPADSSRAVRARRSLSR